MELENSFKNIVYISTKCIYEFNESINIKQNTKLFIKYSFVFYIKINTRLLRVAQVNAQAPSEPKFKGALKPAWDSHVQNVKSNPQILSRPVELALFHRKGNIKVELTTCLQP